MDRPDITDQLVHFTKGDTIAEAFATFRKILDEKRLIGGTGFIKGQYPCVCFFEAPLQYLAYALSQRTQNNIRYQPFGILVTKRWLFERGGRPVIYQSDDEYFNLPENIRWRHVRYEPTADPTIDFTWEREWRIRTAELRLDPDSCKIVVPTRDEIRKLVKEHERKESYQYQMYSMILDEMIAWQLSESFPWQEVVLEDLGIPFH